MRILAAFALAACCVSCLDERLPSGSFAAQTAAELPDASDAANDSGGDSGVVDSGAVDSGGDGAGTGPCTAGTASEECNDGNPCTTDSCANGACSHVGLTLVPCTQAGKSGTCQNGVCK